MKIKWDSLMKLEPTYKLIGYEWDCTHKVLSKFGNIRYRFYRQYLRILKEADVITDLLRSVHQRFFGCHGSFRLLPLL